MGAGSGGPACGASGVEPGARIRVRGLVAGPECGGRMRRPACGGPGMGPGARTRCGAEVRGLRAGGPVWWGPGRAPRRSASGCCDRTRHPGMAVFPRSSAPVAVVTQVPAPRGYPIREIASGRGNAPAATRRRHLLRGEISPATGLVRTGDGEDVLVTRVPAPRSCLSPRDSTRSHASPAPRNSETSPAMGPIRTDDGEDLTVTARRGQPNHNHTPGPLSDPTRRTARSDGDSGARPA